MTGAGRPTPVEIYRGRIADIRTRLDAASRRSLRVGTARAATFVVLVLAGLAAEVRPGTLPLVAAAVATAAFIALVVVHGRIRAVIRRCEVLDALNREGLSRLARSWAELPHRAASPDSPAPATAKDLDLFGSASLAQLLGPVGTPDAHTILERYLLDPPRTPSLGERQAAVRDLACRIDFRDELAAAARLDPLPAHGAIERFLHWAESPAGTETATIRFARFAGPATFVALSALALAGLVPPSLVLVPVFVASALSFGAPGRAARRRLNAAFGSEQMFQAYPRLFEHAGSEAFEAPLLVRLREQLGTGPHGATSRMRALTRLAHLAALRSSGMLYVPVQLITLWDFHVIARVREWHAQTGPHVREWLEALGTIEALSALATLAHDEPDWVFAETTDERALDAAQLGHPMIPAAQRVANDVRVGPPGTFLLITGSNMSGKSTLLRAIGQNCMLANSGAPACARRIRLPALRLQTSIHVEDSLADGISFFMAQLHRVKSIVDAARTAAAEGVAMLYLLDEILQGTNSAERRIAATRVIRHLLDKGAIGAVTTHDLELGDDPSLEVHCVPVHFSETVVPDRETALTFDYRLRPGVATSTNALKLMQIVGLNDDEEES